MSEKIIVKRANVLLDVPAEQKDEYLAKGFDVIDKSGKVLTYATKTSDPKVLQRKLDDAHETIKKLKEEIKRLNEEIKRLNEELDEIAGMDEEEDTQEGLVDPEPTVTKAKKKSSK